MDAFTAQNPTPREVNIQIGLAAAVLVQTFNQYRLTYIAKAIARLGFYSTDNNQKTALTKISLEMRKNVNPISFQAFATALSPS